MSSVSSLGAVDEEKRQAKLAQLEAVNEQRQVEKEKRRQDKAQGADPEEHVASFLSQFNTERSVVVQAIEDLKLRQPATDMVARLPIKEEADRISRLLFKLDHAISSAAYFLPAFEVRSLTAAVQSLRTELQQARDVRLPHVPFAFSDPTSLVLVTDPMAQGLQTKEELENALHATNAPRVEQPCSLSDSIGQDAATTISNQTGARILLSADQLGHRDWMLQDLQDCVVLLHGPMQALYLHRLHNCHIQAGPIDGATFGEDLAQCILMVATHQLRLHRATASSVYVRPGSDPIIEHCTDIAFAPLSCLPFLGWLDAVASAELPADTEESAWQRVQDFQYPGHKESPNWRVIEPSQRIQACELDACVLPSDL